MTSGRWSSGPVRQLAGMKIRRLVEVLSRANVRREFE
jgi:hypothetical protein